MNCKYREALLFKRMFHKDKPTSYLLLNYHNGKVEPTNLYGPLKRNWKTISQQGVEANVHMLINQSQSKSRNSKDISKVNATFIDYDGGDWSANNFKEFMTKFPVKPHLVVNTSPGNFHVYWLIKDMPLEKFAGIQKKLASKFKSDSKVCDLSRVMRMPGTINFNHDKPFLVKTIYSDEATNPILLERFIEDMFESNLNIAASDESECLIKNTTSKTLENNNQSVLNALNFIPPNDRKVWITVGMALHAKYGNSGLKLFKDWSKSSIKYDEDELLRQWHSFKPKGGISIRTLFWLAKINSSKTIKIGKDVIAPANAHDLSKRFIEKSAELLRHSESENIWYVFSNGRWEKSPKAAKYFALCFLEELKAAAIKTKNAKYAEYIERNLSSGTVRELLSNAEIQPVLSIGSSAFDQTPNKLCVKFKDIEGTVSRYYVFNLETKKHSYVKPEDMVLKIAGAHYVHKATCSLWLSFLDAVTENDDELVNFLKMAVGYTLYGHAKEQVMFILIGSGGNGKGVFSNLIYALLGEYAAVIQSNLLKPGAINANNPSPALMKLKDKRLWICSEVPKGMMLDEALTKQITGGDRLSSRQLYGEQVEFQTIGKLWLSANNMPRVRYDDNGMWRRIIAIPFNAKFTGKNRDNDLENKLKLELPGILNWALEGAFEYAKLGKLIPPKASKQLLEKLRYDVDTVGNWLESRCKVQPKASIPSQVAYDDYTETMSREKLSTISNKDFKADLVGRGYQHKRTGGHNVFLGIELMKN